jgi:CheY-like chemotaxis protein/HPt (histidine-containing phosphotransfer) domain-containing protein
MLISGAPVMNDSGVVTGSMGIHYDISPQKKLEADLIRAKEEADDARQAEKEFLAQMSHEIRTPLNAVIGMTNLLSDTHLNPEQETYVRDVKHAADVLHGLISDILDLSKIEAGQMELSPSLVNIHQTVVMMCRTMKVKAEENGNQLDYFIGDKVPQLMRLDRNILNQVLLNLIGNAIKFTHNGKIALHLDTQIDEDGKCLLQVKIVDTGIGIPESKLPDIFEKFKQAEGRNTHKKYGGTGLGLPICKKLVELHGGNIHVESETGKGSTFRFELKGQLADENSSGQLSTADGTSGASVDFTKLKFLIVEDTFMNQRYIQSILKRWSSDSELANNGKEAVELSENERFDLILMDMQMPVMDGYEATRVIRADKTNPNHRAPIIALTASALLDDRRKALAAGMDEHLTKPFTPDQLKAAIQTQLSGSGESNPAERVPLPLAFRVTKVKQEHIDLYFGGDMDYAKEMVLEFLRSLPSERENIGRLIQSKDPAALSNWLHSMYPVVAMLGAPELSKEIKTKQLTVNESGWTDELVRWSEQLDTALSDLGDTLEKWVEGQMA